LTITADAAQAAKVVETVQRYWMELNEATAIGDECEGQRVTRSSGSCSSASVWFTHG